MFKPYHIGTESCQIEDLVLENQEDVVNLYGNLQLYKDQVSLQHAKRLQTLLNDIVAELEQLQEQQQLPEKVVFETIKNVDNPFVE